MKLNYLVKVFYIFILLLGIQYAYSDNLSFEFIYTQGIESVVFDHTTNGSYETAAKNDGLSISTTSSISSPYKVTINTDIENGSSAIAEDFKTNLDYYSTTSGNYLHMVQLTATEVPPSNLDFMVRGALYINGESMTDEFYLAHTNHKHGDPDWWIGTLDGTRYSPTSSMTVHSTSGNYYCLNQNSTNYQVTVTSGKCNQNQIYSDNWTSEKNKKFRFEYGSSIESMIFIYDGISDDIHHDEEYFEDVTPSTYNYGYEVTVTSKLEADTGTATSFINKFNPNTPESNMLQMNSKDTLSTPDKLYFWVEGSLYINNELVASDFTLAYDEHGKWWIGSINGSSTINGAPEMQLDEYCFIIKQGGGDASSDDDWSVRVTTATSGTCPTIDPNNGFGPVM